MWCWLLVVLMGGTGLDTGAPAPSARRRDKRGRSRVPAIEDPYDTVFAARNGFDPRTIKLKPRVRAATEVDTDWWAAFRGIIEVDPTQAGLSPDKDFVARGVQMAGAPLFCNYAGKRCAPALRPPGTLRSGVLVSRVRRQMHAASRSHDTRTRAPRQRAVPGGPPVVGPGGRQNVS